MGILSLNEKILFFEKIKMERFSFLRTYADSLNELAKADQGLAEKLARRIIQYWIYENNESSWNPVVEAMFVQIKVMLDNWKEISEKRRKANQKRTNIEQNLTSKEQKKNKNEQNLTNDEQNTNKTLTNDEQTALKYKIENNKIENNNITLTSNTETKVSEYWNPEINRLIELVKVYNWGLIDWTQKASRQYWKLLLDKLKKIPSVEKWDYQRNEVLETILRIISENKYHSSKIVSVESIYRNLTLLMQECKKASRNQEQVVLETV